MRWSDKSKGTGALGSRPGWKPVAGRRFDVGGARHRRAVAQSCRFAQEAADTGDLRGALAWLQAVEVVDGPLAPEWDAKRALWLHEDGDGGPGANGRPQHLQSAASKASRKRP
jgi:hypothetical protein